MSKSQEKRLLKIKAKNNLFLNVSFLSILSVTLSLVSLVLIHGKANAAGQQYGYVPGCDTSYGYTIPSAVSNYSQWDNTNYFPGWTAGNYHYIIYGFTITANGGVYDERNLGYAPEIDSWQCNSGGNNAGPTTPNNFAGDLVNAQSLTWNGEKPDYAIFGVPEDGAPNNNGWWSNYVSTNTPPDIRPPLFMSDMESDAVTNDDVSRAVIGGNNNGNPHDRTIYCLGYTPNPGVTENQPNGFYDNCKPNLPGFNATTYSYNAGGNTQLFGGAGYAFSTNNCKLENGGGGYPNPGKDSFPPPNGFTTGCTTNNPDDQICGRLNKSVFSWEEIYIGCSTDLTGLIGTQFDNTQGMNVLSNFFLHLSDRNTYPNGFGANFYMTLAYQEAPPAIIPPVVTQVTPSCSGGNITFNATEPEDPGDTHLPVSYTLQDNTSSYTASSAPGQDFSNGDGTYTIPMSKLTAGNETLYDQVRNYTVTITVDSVNAVGQPNPHVYWRGSPLYGPGGINCFTPQCGSFQLPPGGLEVGGGPFNVSVSETLTGSGTPPTSDSNWTLTDWYTLNGGPPVFGNGNPIFPISNNMTNLTTQYNGLTTTGTYIFYMQFTDKQANSTLTYDTASCNSGPNNVGYKPYLQINGGDIIAGSKFGIGADCTDNNSNGQPNQDAVLGWNGDTSPYTVGAGTSYAGSALGVIDGFATGQNTATNKGDGLSFANLNNLDVNGNASDNPNNDQFGGNFGYATCANDYGISGLPSSLFEPAMNNTIDLGGGGSGESVTASKNYYFNQSAAGPITLDENNLWTNFPNNTDITLFINGSVNITTNINVYNGGSWNLPTDIPSLKLIVFGGNIYVDYHVTSLDGIYVSEPDTHSNGGTINTCVDTGNNDTFPGFDNCNNSSGSPAALTVNGSFIANAIEFQRTYGNIYNVNGGTPAVPAELFNYNPQLWLSQSDNQNDQSIAGLPPTL